MLPYFRDEKHFLASDSKCFQDTLYTGCPKKTLLREKVINSLRGDVNWKNPKNFSFWPKFSRPPPPSSKKGPTDENIGILYLIIYHSFLYLATLLCNCFVLFNLKFENPKKDISNPDRIQHKYIHQWRKITFFTRLKWQY